MAAEDRDAMPADRRTSVQSVDRAFSLLRELAAKSVPRSVLELSTATGIDRTVAHRLLKTLSRQQMVMDEGGTYRLGPESVLLANAYVDSLQVRRLALPYMVDMQAHDLNDVPWTVSLSIPVGAISTVVERIWTPRTPLDVVLSSSDNLPLESTGTGRSILAYYPVERVREILGTGRAETLADTLQAIRDAGGVGMSHGEAIAGVDGIAAAIRAPNGEPVAALAVVGVDLGDELSYESRLAHKLRRTAQAIGRLITG
jgi:IclR family transcriptional regulator, acetate operon repressor